MHFFINGLGASAGGGLTYLYNVLPHLAKAGVRSTVAVGPEFSKTFSCDQTEFLRIACPGGSARRFWFEQKQLPALIQNCGADVLLSAGNFALYKSPVPQILLSRNSLYRSTEFARDLVTRREYRMLLETKIKGILAKKSIDWADCTIAPSESFARELEVWTHRRVIALHHGFDHQFFVANQQGLPEEISKKLNRSGEFFRIVLVSHYNYYRNFETVFRGIAEFKKMPRAPEVRLFLTCELEKDKTPGAYNPHFASQLIEQLGIREQVVELGAVPYELLHHVYRACDLFVTAAYTETFAHPLVEAMSCGVPIIASDLPVHREICGDAALYFDRFSASDLSDRLSQLASSFQKRKQMTVAGRARSQAFSWQLHVKDLVAIADRLLKSAGRMPSEARSASAA